MDIVVVPRDTPFKSAIIDLFELVDNHATNTHYNTSTANLARRLCLTDIASNVTDKTALTAFYEALTDHAILAFDNNYNLIGFTLVAYNDPQFLRILPECTPHVAIHFSAVHPDHQRTGIWTALRNEVENTLAPRYGADYLVTAAADENTASRNANQNHGLTHQTTLTSDIENSPTHVYSKPLNLNSE